MSAWIEINGVRSTTFDGVMVTDITPFLLPRKRATRTSISGRIGAIDNGEPTLDTAEYTFKLAVRGSGREQVMQRVRALGPWLNGRKLRSYLEPDKYCIGQIESEVNPSKLHKNVAEVVCRFTAVPPVMYKPPTGFDPDMTAAIPEQITAANCSAQASLPAGYFGAFGAGSADFDCAGRAAERAG